MPIDRQNIVDDDSSSINSGNSSSKFKNENLTKLEHKLKKLLSRSAIDPF